jgi:predicted phosphate transport protein (TIGR00153 family)
MFGSKVRDRDFFDAFTKHAKLCVEGARKLSEILENPAHAEKLAEQVKQLEHDGDTITHETVKRLHETWITPLDRHDIHDLITRLDDVLDMIEAVSERVAIFRVQKRHDLSVQLAKVLSKACEILEAAVAGVADVTKSSHKILDAAVEINRLENEADDIYRKALGELFNPAEGAQVNTLEIMKWREIFDYLENATDACEDVANVLEAIVLEYA